MNRPLLNFQFSESDLRLPQGGKVAQLFPLQAAANGLYSGGAPAAANSFALGHFKAGTEQSDRKWLDYLILGALSIVIHASAVDYFDKARVGQEEIIEPAKVPPKVEITLVKPKPKPIIQPPPPPPPKVQAPPKPPVPKAVPLKPQPKIKPKPVEKQLEPPPVQQTVPAIESKAPISPVAQPTQQPAVEEKVTEPSAGAEYLNNPSPEYPESAMDRGLEGKVLMKVHVQPNGKPDTINVIKSSGHPILDDAAVKTVRQWSFVPAMRGKTPIAGWVTVPIAFNLQN